MSFSICHNYNTIQFNTMCQNGTINTHINEQYYVSQLDHLYIKSEYKKVNKLAETMPMIRMVVAEECLASGSLDGASSAAVAAAAVTFSSVSNSLKG